MATTFLAATPIQDTFFLPGTNTPGNGVQLFCYAAGSSTKTTVYKDNAGATPHTNPIVLDSGGNIPLGGEVWQTQGQSMKYVYAPSNDTDPPASPYRTLDNMPGTNDVSAQTGVEWLTGPTPTFVSGTQFTLVGDQTATFTIGRRLKFTVTAGTVYGRIVASAFGALTTVTLVMDGTQALDAGLSAVSYGLLASNVLSEPTRTGSTSAQDTYTASLGLSRYVLGDEYKIKFTSTNTLGAPTLNSDGLGTRTLVRPDGTTLKPGDISGEHLARVASVSTVAILNPLSGASVIPSYLSGLVLSTAGASSTMTIGAGVAADTSSALMMNLASALNKNTGAWAAGSNAGGLDTGVISTSAWYHFFEMQRPDTAVVDGIFTTSNVGPVLPANYKYIRRIGSGKTNSSALWTAFVQDGDLFQWAVPLNEANVANPGTNAVTIGLTVPSGLNTIWVGSAGVFTNAGQQSALLLSDLATTDTAPTSALADVVSGTAAGNNTWMTYRQCRANSSGAIRYRLSVSNASTTVLINTFGWIDRRGRDS